MGYKDWSQIPDNNAAVDPTINAKDRATARHYMPAIRGVMAGVASLREDFSSFSPEVIADKLDDGGAGDVSGMSVTADASAPSGTLARLPFDLAQPGNPVGDALKALTPPTQRVNVASWPGVDATGLTDSQAGLKALFAWVQAQNTSRPRSWYLDFGGGTYRITWDKISTITKAEFGPDTFEGGGNQRYCLRLNNINGLTFDLTGAKLIKGGERETFLPADAPSLDQWATAFRLHDCQNVRVLGGEFDYETVPFFEGAITAKGADYIDVTMHAGTVAPQFGTAWQVEIRNADHTPYSAGLLRNSLQSGESPYTITSQGGGVYRVSGFSAPDVATFNWTGLMTVGRNVFVRAAHNGAQWFTLVSCDGVTFEGGRVYACGDCFSYSVASKNFSMRDYYAGPPHGLGPRSKMRGSIARGLCNWFSAGGYTNIDNVTCIYNGDDVIAVQQVTFKTMTRISATQFEAFLSAHFYYAIAPVGSNVIIYDGDWSEVARCRITAVGATLSGFRRSYTVEIISGALPSDMTTSYGVVQEYIARGSITNVKTFATRGRSVWSDISGVIAFNHFRYNSDEAILTEIERTNVKHWLSKTASQNIVHNIIEYPCLNTFYAAGILVRSTNPLLAGANYTLPNGPTSSVYPKRNVRISGNTIRFSTNMAIYAGGVDGLSIEDNLIESAATTGTAADYYTGLTSCVIGLDNVRSALIARNKGRAIGSASWVKMLGTCVNVSEDDNRTLDAPTAEVVSRQHTGDMFRGIKGAAHASFGIDKGGSGFRNRLTGRSNGSARWHITLGDTTAETGSNVGSDLNIQAVADDGGTVVWTPFSFSRSVAAMSVGGSMSVSGNVNAVSGGVLRVNSISVTDTSAHLQLRSYTVATLPTASPAGRMIYVSDGAGDKRFAVTDGTSWRFPDGAIVS